MEILPNGVAVCGKGWHQVWCRTEGLIHDKWFAEQICRHIKPGDTVIEGGAHIGTLTWAMLDAGAAVMAFEPNPEALSCLRINCPEAFVSNAALGCASSECETVVNNDNSGMSFTRPGTGTRVSKLDDFYPGPIQLIKLDCEGAETDILSGGLKLIRSQRPIIITEVNAGALRRAGSSEDDLLLLIRGLGYKLQILQPECKRGDPQYDILCLPE